MNRSKLNFLSIVGFLSVATIILLSLPYSWCGLSSWLESLITKTYNCGCICPWWLFVIGQIITAYFLFLLAQSIKKHIRLKYVILQFTIAMLFFFFHGIVHSYYLQREVYQESVFCNWMWLIGLIIAIIFSLLPIYKNKKD